MTAARIRLVARWPRSADGRSTFVIGSATLHAALALAVLLWPGFRSRPVSIGPAIQVVLVAPERSAVAAPRALPAPPEAKPEPAPQATPKEVRPAKEPRPEKQPAAPPPSPPAPAGTGDSSGTPGTPGTSGPLGAVELQGMGAEFDWYRDAVIRALHASWEQPFLPDSTTVLEVGVGFEILRDGSVRAVRIESSSGVPALDRSALRAVVGAALPPLPREFPEPTQPARFVFRLDPETRG